MSDNSTQTGADTIATDDVTTLNGVASSGVKVQRVKIAYGNDGTSRDVSGDFPLPVREQSDTGTVTSVAASTSTTTLLASNANRLGASVYNDSAVSLYLAAASGATSSAHTVKVPPGAIYEIPFGYTGIITGAWDSATGNARVTEYT